MWKKGARESLTTPLPITKKIQFQIFADETHLLSSFVFNFLRDFYSLLFIQINWQFQKFKWTNKISIWQKKYFVKGESKRVLANHQLQTSSTVTTNALPSIRMAYKCIDINKNGLRMLLNVANMFFLRILGACFKSNLRNNPKKSTND